MNVAKKYYLDELFAVWGNSAVQVTPATTYKNFRNVPPTNIPLIPKLSDIGNQYTTFG
jgi:hypothetical protein